MHPLLLRVQEVLQASTDLFSFWNYIWQKMPRVSGPDQGNLGGRYKRKQKFNFICSGAERKASLIWTVVAGQFYSKTGSTVHEHKRGIKEMVKEEKSVSQWQKPTYKHTHTHAGGCCVLTHYYSNYSFQNVGPEKFLHWLDTEQCFRSGPVDGVLTHLRG